MRRLLLIAPLLAALPLAARAEIAAHLTPAEAEAAFRGANEACMREDYDGCIQGYERLIASGFGGADLYFNLGTAYLRQNRVGWATLYLERSLRIDPGDLDAQANLERARRMRVDRLVGAPEETGGSEPLTSRVVFHTRASSWTLGFLLLWTGGWLLVLLRRFAVPGRRAALGLVGALAVVLSLPCAAVMGAHIYVAERAHDAIVVAPALPVREGPDAALKPTFEVHEGLKVRLLDREGAFRRVRLSNGLQGWVPVEGVVEVAEG